MPSRCARAVRERAVVVHGKPTSGPGFPVHPPRRHLALERGLEGRDQMLKLVERHARDIQKRQRTGLQLGEPYTGHGSCLLSLYGDVRGASYQKESGINSIIEALPPLLDARRSPPRKRVIMLVASHSATRTRVRICTETYGLEITLYSAKC